MILVTGAAGFIGSHIVETLNHRGIEDIMIVDDLTDGNKFSNLLPLRYTEYLDKDDFRARLADPKFLQNVSMIFHQGACSDTMERNGKYMLDNNYQFSKELLDVAIKLRIPFIYASSAAVYGRNLICKEDPAYESPLNVYGYSKLLFDQYVRRRMMDAHSQIVGLRYFNVYGSREDNKGKMSSVIHQWCQRVQTNEALRLFEGSDGYGPGEQRRDFIYVKDVASINMWYADHTDISGIFNCGTGTSVSFNDVAKAIIEQYGKGSIKYIPFPEGLRASYQSYTQADLQLHAQVNHDLRFTDIPCALADLCAVAVQS